MVKQNVVRDQFNKQAEQFSNWSITKNTEYMERYFNFLELTPEDDLLDVACGSGEFSIFCAQRIHSVQGIDLSDKMIGLAKKQAALSGVQNTRFLCHPVERLPFDDRTFSVVICKSAFHHLEDCQKVLFEMIRCVKPGGKISVQDIAAYDTIQVDSYFEKLEKIIDRSHQKTLSKETITGLFTGTTLSLLKRVEVEIDLDCRDYIRHAVQSPNDQARIEQWLAFGQTDSAISGFFQTRDDQLFFKRTVFLILGQKPLFMR